VGDIGSRAGASGGAEGSGCVRVVVVFQESKSGSVVVELTRWCGNVKEGVAVA